MDISLWNCGETCSKVRKTVSHRKCTEVCIFMRPGCFSVLKFVVIPWYESVLMGGVWISLQYSVVLQAVQMLQHVFILKPLNVCQSEREFNAIVFSWFVIYTLQTSLYSVSFHNQLNVQPIDTREGVWHTAKGEFMSHMTQYGIVDLCKDCRDCMAEFDLWPLYPSLT